MSTLAENIELFTQEEGSDVELKVSGDEYYNTKRTLSDYTVKYDVQKGQYCYAILNEKGQLESSGISITESVPDSLPTGLEEDPDVKEAKFTAKYNQFHEDDHDASSASTSQAASQKPDNGLTSSGLLHGTFLGDEPKVRGITVLVNFNDVKTSFTKDFVNAALNSDSFTQYSQVCSVKEYFTKMSTGKLEYTNLVVGPIQLSKNRSYYISNHPIKEIFSIILNDLPAMGPYDCKNRKVVDSINFLYAGRAQYSGHLWPHNWSVRAATRGQEITSKDGFKFQNYTIQALGERPQDIALGTFVHEAGHAICRFPDLYDYGRRQGDTKRSAGLGRYCLMSYGNRSNQPPAPLCSYLRHLAGWTETVDLNNHSGALDIAYDAWNKAYKYKHTTASNEYFLLENRSKLGLNVHCPDSGLAVYHCDNDGRNEWQDGEKFKHFQCAVLQADGKKDLESNKDAGDADDLYSDKSGVAVSSATNPNSKFWDGSDSGLSISDVGSAGATMRVSINASGGGKPNPPTTSKDLVKTSSPNITIPDANSAGIIDTINITERGTIERVKLDINITHTYMADLVITLVHVASGKNIKLHDKVRTLKTSHTSDSSSTLSALVGESISGDWQVKACDLARADIGKLVSWKLTIKVKAADKPVKPAKPTLSGKAQQVGGNKGLLLTPAQTETTGSINWDQARPDNLASEFTFKSNGGTGGQSSWFYCLADNVPTTEQGGSVNKGYIISASEWDEKIAVYYGKTKLKEVTQASIDDGQWHKMEVSIAGKKITVKLDGVKKIEFEDTKRDKAGTKSGFGARTGTMTNNHYIKDMSIK
jgi:M6 family metalloprotease-like protein